MARSIDDFLDMMLALLPRGAAWPRDRDSQFADLLYAAAVEFSDIDSRSEQLLREMSPYSCAELLEDWETEYALPGDCIQYVQTTNERRNALTEKYARLGEQSKQFFIDAAAMLGYTITITEYDQNNPGPQADYNGIPLAGDAWNFVWQINAPSTTVVRKRCGTACGEPLTTFGNELLECTLRELAHAHRVLFFAYAS